MTSMKSILRSRAVKVMDRSPGMAQRARQLYWHQLTRRRYADLDPLTRQPGGAELGYLSANPSLRFSHGFLRYPLGDRMPNEITRHSLELVSSMLQRASIPWFLVRNSSRTRYTVAVMEAHREAVLQALESWALQDAVYLENPEVRRGPIELVSKVAQQSQWRELPALRLGLFFDGPQESLRLGMGYGCDLEFWSEDPAADVLISPRRNEAAQALGKRETAAATRTVGDTEYPTLAVFNQRMLDDISFPVDVVYTWVDGDDPTWRALKDEYSGAPAAAGHHPSATYDSRFISRDELKYSLRSLAMYAPWVRRIFLVTSGQVPEWLDLDNPQIELVSHADIYGHAGQLPTFNSNSIISRLHHIEGLSEHYVYMNDDVFLGRMTGANQFFLPSGIAKVTPANNRRPFGAASSTDEPHFNLSRNIRELLQQEFGVTISRAIKHTPHPQLKSVHLEMENRFLDRYESTWSSRFRHHDDIVADQLFHYYAQITGSAIPAPLNYEYINIQDIEHAERLETLQSHRNRDCFCLNDAPEPGVEPLPGSVVRAFLESYFPLKSAFEK